MSFVDGCTGIAAVIAAAGTFRNAAKINKVQVTVNGEKERLVRRVEQLTAHLTKNNVTVPPSPGEK